MGSPVRVFIVEEPPLLRRLRIRVGSTHYTYRRQNLRRSYASGGSSTTWRNSATCAYTSMGSAKIFRLGVTRRSASAAAADPISCSARSKKPAKQSVRARGRAASAD